MAQFNSITLNNSSVPGLGRNIVTKHFIASPDELTISSTKGTSGASNWPIYGTNGSFFVPSTRKMCTAHVVNDKSIEAATNNTSWVIGGDKNYADIDTPKYPWDMMNYRSAKPPVSGSGVSIIAKTGTWSKNAAWVDNWVIGGVNLLLNKTCTSQSAHTSELNTYYGATASWIPSISSGRARTAIGYRSSDDKTVIGIFYGAEGASYYNDGPTIYQLYLIMKNYFSCNIALSLDGGGSTMVRYKSNTGVNQSLNGDGRNVNCIIGLTQSAANSCNW